MHSNSIFLWIIKKNFKNQERIGFYLEKRSKKQKSEKNQQNNAKYIIIRSLEINSHVVDHPLWNDLDDDVTFDDFIRKKEEGEEEEGKGERKEEEEEEEEGVVIGRR